MNLRFSQIIFAGIISSASYVHAECSFALPVFEGELEVAAVDEGMLPTMLATPADSLSQVLLNCDQGTTAVLRVLPPQREDNRVPSLKTKPRSFFIYQGERYGIGEERESALVTGSLEDEPIQVGITVGNGQDVLLASDDYRYTTIVQLTIEEESEEEATGNILGEDFARTIEAVIGREP